MSIESSFFSRTRPTSVRPALSMRSMGEKVYDAAQRRVNATIALAFAQYWGSAFGAPRWPGLPRRVRVLLPRAAPGGWRTPRGKMAVALGAGAGTAGLPRGGGGGERAGRGGAALPCTHP